MGEVAMIVKSKTLPNKRDEVYELYRRLLAPRAENNEGQEVVVWCADQHDAEAFYLFEIYRDAETMGANAQAPWFGEYMAAVAPLLAGEPEVSMAAPLWSKGV